MKKFLLSLATVLCAGAFASADEVTFSFYTSLGLNNYGLEPAYTDSNTKYIDNGATATQDPITITLAGAADKECWRNWSDGLRAYGKTASKKPSLKISGTDITITNVSFSLKAGLTITADKGTMTNTASSKENTWNGEAPDVTFTFTGANAAIQVLTITYTKAGGVDVAEPTFSPAGGRFADSQTVTITPAAGTTVYYTLDGATPSETSTKYVAPFELTESTAVKAIAYDADGNKSNVVTENYFIYHTLEGAEGEGTLEKPYNAIAAINQANSGATDVVYVKGIVSKIEEISTQYGNATYYISVDGTETNQFYIYRGKDVAGANFTDAEAFKVGDTLLIKGTLTLYNESPQLQPSEIVEYMSGVEGVEMEDNNAPVEYFNLQGVRVDNPTCGLYIMRQGNKVEKVIK